MLGERECCIPYTYYVYTTYTYYIYTTYTYCILHRLSHIFFIIQLDYDIIASHSIFDHVFILSFPILNFIPFIINYNTENSKKSQIDSEDLKIKGSAVLAGIEGPQESTAQANEPSSKTWKLELNNYVWTSKIHDQATLHTQIKEDLKKQLKQLPLSQIIQLLILSNFAILCLKNSFCITASEEIAKQWHHGNGKWFFQKIYALAWYYQAFEQLPLQHHGGFKNAHSLLKDENIKAVVTCFPLKLTNWQSYTGQIPEGTQFYYSS